MVPEPQPDPPPALTVAERCDLLWIARATIRAAVRGEEPPALSNPSRVLCEPGAAFVSLHCEQRLRGCIGTMTADAPLHHTVARMARSAALDDRRFPPLVEIELDDLTIEISRLSPLTPVRAEDVVPGVHGVSVRAGDHRAVFLPQVASHYAWDRETLLTELCRKALLPQDAWKRPDARLMAFTAEVFGEQA
jgi:AmmeMemoRadiSam system protein A